MKQFVKNIITLSAILAVIVGGINGLYIYHTVNFGTMGTCKNDSAFIENVPDGIDICNLGNSQGYYGFNYEEYVNEYSCFNFSLPSQSMTYNYRILRNYQDRINKGADIYICISYVDFFGKEETEERNFLSKNKRYYKFLDEEYIKDYDRYTDIYVNYLPALTADLPDLIRTIAGRDGGGVCCWENTTCEKEAVGHGMARYKRHVENNVDPNGQRIVNEEEINAVYEIIELSRNLEATPILVTTPYLEEYVQAIRENDPEFYNDFYSIINNIIKNTEVEYYDYQNDSRFMDNYDLFLIRIILTGKGQRFLLQYCFRIHAEPVQKSLLAGEGENCMDTVKINNIQKTIYLGEEKGRMDVYQNLYLDLIDEMRGKECLSILDIGGGAGFFARWIKERVLEGRNDIQLKITVVDSIRYDTWDNKDDCVRYVQSDAVFIDSILEKDRYDYIFCNMFVHHLIGKSYKESGIIRKKCFMNLHKLLKADGKLLIADNVNNGFLYEEASARILYAVTTCRNSVIKKILFKMGVHSAGVGVCMLSQGMWESLLNETEFQIKEARMTEPQSWNFVKKVLLMNREYRERVLFITQKKESEDRQ